MDITGRAPGEHFLGREGRHIAQSLGGLGMRYSRFTSTHEGDPAAVACTAQDFVIDLQVIQDIQHGQGDLRCTQDVTAEVEDYVRRPLTLADRPWEQALNIFGTQLYAEEEPQGAAQRFEIVPCGLLRRLGIAGGLLPTEFRRVSASILRGFTPSGQAGIHRPLLEQLSAQAWASGEITPVRSNSRTLPTTSPGSAWAIAGAYCAWGRLPHRCRTAYSVKMSCFSRSR